MCKSDHSSSPPPHKKRPTLHERLGGAKAVQAAVNEFYRRVTADEALAPFFGHANMMVLKKHQVEFFKLAFTGIPANLDVGAYLIDKHAHLFAQGLNAAHFDLVAEHFAATLEHLGIAPDLVDEAVGVVAPLRAVFEQGGSRYDAGKQKKKEDVESTAAPETKVALKERLGGDAAVKSVVDEFYQRLLADPELSPFFGSINMTLLKVHQIRFMSVAFSTIPDHLDVPALIARKHARLFEQGLNATHFDMVASHFVATLDHLSVPAALQDEAVAVIAPLRVIFEQGAATAAAAADASIKTM